MRPKHQCFFCGRWYDDSTPGKRRRHFATQAHFKGRWGLSGK